MSRAGTLLWRKLFEANDARRLSKQVQDASDLSIKRDIAYIDDGDRGHLFDIYRLPDAPAGAPAVANVRGSVDEVAQSGELLGYERDHLARVRAGLAECMMLLRKDGSFPLAKPCKLAAFGNGVRHGVKGGTRSGDVNAHVVVGIERGLVDAGFQLTSGAWLDAYDECRLDAKAAFRKQLKREAKAAGDFVITYAMGAVMPEPDYDLPLDFSADASIYVLSRISGEGSDRKPVAGDVLLTATEIRDILALNERYERCLQCGCAAGRRSRAAPRRFGAHGALRCCSSGNRGGRLRPCRS